MKKKNRKNKNKIKKVVEDIKLTPNMISFENKIYDLDIMSIEEIKKLKSKLEKYKNSIEIKLEALVE